MPEGNNSIAIIFIAVIALIIILVALIATVLYLYQKRQHAFQVEIETMKEKYERELWTVKFEVQEETLQFISRDLHDNIGQFITLAKLNLFRVERMPGTKTDELLCFAEDMLAKALDDLRDLSKSLSLDLIREAGLVHAIETHINQLKRTGEIAISFELSGDYQFLDEKKEIIMFRIMQEALSNAYRHAQARTLKVSLECSPSTIILTVTDDGIGFTIPPPSQYGKPASSGSGIGHMMARTKLIGADFSVESVNGTGTVIWLTVPIQSENGTP